MGADSVATVPATAEGATVRRSSAERYVLLEKLGEGAMGVVWAARDTALDRKVALKVLNDRHLGALHQERLADEARAMARLSHPNVVAVYDVGERDGRTFVTMELIDGQPLSQWLETPRSWRDVVAVFRAAGDGLAAAHAAGIVHRDVKPSNILIGVDGRPRVADFGVAHATETAVPIGSVTDETAGMIGSPAYMSLERLCGEPAGPRGDQFSFCISLYEALHGRRPFEARTLGLLIAAIARGVPPPVRPVPRWLHAAIVRGLDPDPDRRWSSMTALTAALAGPPRRRLLTVGASILAVATAATLTIALTRTPSHATRPPSPASPSQSQSPSPTRAQPSAQTQAPSPSTTTTTSTLPSPSMSTTTTTTTTTSPSTSASPSPAPAVQRTNKQSKPTNAWTAEAASLSDTDARARYHSLLTSSQAAFKQKHYADARRDAERAIPYARGGSDARTLSATSSCWLGDETRARTHLSKIPHNQHDARIAIVRICRRAGIELEDLLDEYERVIP